MSDRLATLLRALQPAGREFIKPELASLFLVMAARNVEVDEARAIQRIYEETLAGLPAFALRSAFHKYRMGSDRWMPTPGQIYQVAEDAERFFRNEVGQLEKLLRAKPAPSGKPSSADERRAAIARARRPQHVEEPLGDAPRARDERDKKAEEAAAKRRLEEMAREVGNEWRGDEDLQ